SELDDQGRAAWATTFNGANTALWELQTDGSQAAAHDGAADAVLAAVRAGLVGGVGLIAVIAVLVIARRSGATAAPTERGARSGTARTAGPAYDTGIRPLLRDLERRNHGLLRRQQRLLDTLARRETDDDTLGDLFRADHLANRMLRNLEKSIILAGGTPEHRRRDAVPLADVVRAAAAEVSEYGRVATSRIAPVALAGAATTDVMHLLAELIENAVTFAPAETRVRVTGEDLPDGYLITVTDVGPGMTGDDLDTAARVLTDPEPPTGGTWWGLYAAGRFAARHDVAVSLRNGLDGGLSAEILIPASLIGPFTPNTPTDPGFSGESGFPDGPGLPDGTGPTDSTGLPDEFGIPDRSGILDGSGLPAGDVHPGGGELPRRAGVAARTGSDDDAESLVPLYARIGGSTPMLRDSLELSAIVHCPPEIPEPDGLSPEQLAALRLVRQPLAVSEVAVRLGLPVGPTGLLLGELRAAGLIEVRQRAVSSTVLDQLLSGLRSL
ncbi:DUF742 domain-containing protein, partial [Actinoplanes sp. NPDC051851]|uniref:DUF742 domain-containing protein n=1 Tax=Actinoplanes sp. NPDC051851 TaxID=3154753 RepID=UPI00341F9983